MQRVCVCNQYKQSKELVYEIKIKYKFWSEWEQNSI
jgi:hypothetical protein